MCSYVTSVYTYNKKIPKIYYLYTSLTINFIFISNIYEVCQIK